MKTKILLLFTFLFIYTCTFGQKRDAWTSIPISVSGEPYAGKDFRFSAMVKKGAEGNGTAHLWLRVDKKDKTGGFFDNMKDRPITDNEWKRYTIEGTVDKEVQSLVFGVLLYKEGKFYYDDLKLEIKNENGQWDNVSLVNPGFEDGLKGYPIEKLKGYMLEEGYRVRIDTENAPKGKQCLLVEGTKSVITTPFYDVANRLTGYWKNDEGEVVKYEWTVDQKKLVQSLYDNSGAHISTSFIMYDDVNNRVLCDFMVNNQRISLGEGSITEDGLEVSVDFEANKKNRVRYAELVGGQVYLENILNSKFTRKVSLELKDNDSFEIHLQGINRSMKEDSVVDKFENTTSYRRIPKPAFDEAVIQAEIKAMQKELFGAFKEGNYDKAFSMHVNSPQYRNISNQIRKYEEVRSFMGNLKSQGFKSVDYKVIESSFNIINPENVLETANISTSIEMEDGTITPAIPGIATILYQKVDGVWKLGHAHVSDFPSKD